MEDPDNFDFGSAHTRTADSITVNMDPVDYAEEPATNKFDAVLQMVESPGFADSWM